MYTSEFLEGQALDWAGPPQNASIDRLIPTLSHRSAYTHTPTQMGGARAGGEGEPANGVGCPAISGALTTDRARIQRGKVLGLQFRLDRITDWGDAEEIHVGVRSRRFLLRPAYAHTSAHANHSHSCTRQFTFPTGEAHEAHRRRALKPFQQPKMQVRANANAKAGGKGQAQAQQAKGQQQQPVKATAGGGGEEEHAPFIYRNSNVKPKVKFDSAGMDSSHAHPFVLLTTDFVPAPNPFICMYVCAARAEASQPRPLRAPRWDRRVAPREGHDLQRAGVPLPGLWEGGERVGAGPHGLLLLRAQRHGVQLLGYGHRGACAEVGIGAGLVLCVCIHT